MKELADKTAISVSILCAIHCLVIPILFPIALSAGLGFLYSGIFEYSMILLSVCIGIFSLSKEYKNTHRKLYPFYFLVIGLLILIPGKFFEEIEFITTLVGLILVVFAHLVNIYLCRNCPVCTHS